jgi:hypothetical protein
VDQVQPGLCNGAKTTDVSGVLRDFWIKENNMKHLKNQLEQCAFNIKHRIQWLEMLQFYD